MNNLLIEIKEQKLLQPTLLLKNDNDDDDVCFILNDVSIHTIT